MQELRQAFVHFAVSEKGPKWVCLLSMGTKQNGWLFSSNKSGFVAFKGKKYIYNNKERSKHLIRVQTFFLSVLRSWMNHRSFYPLTLLGEYQVLYKQVPQMNLREDCLSVLFRRNGKLVLCLETSGEQEIPTPFIPKDIKVKQQMPDRPNALVRLLVSSLAS